MKAYLKRFGKHIGDDPSLINRYIVVLAGGMEIRNIEKKNFEHSDAIVVKSP